VPEAPARPRTAALPLLLFSAIFAAPVWRLITRRSPAPALFQPVVAEG
jgi:hypothetical protein